MSTEAWIWYCESQSPDVAPELDHLAPHAEELSAWMHVLGFVQNACA